MQVDGGRVSVTCEWGLAFCEAGRVTGVLHAAVGIGQADCRARVEAPVVLATRAPRHVRPDPQVPQRQRIIDDPADLRAAEAPGLVLTRCLASDRRAPP